jgi:hypothetical protein
MDANANEDLTFCSRYFAADDVATRFNQVEVLGARTTYWLKLNFKKVASELPVATYIKYTIVHWAGELFGMLYYITMECLVCREKLENLNKNVENSPVYKEIRLL